jgi:hypothetical protein
MAPSTKEKRRENWKGENFAGTIDWAVDLQDFTSADKDAPFDRPESGEGCIRGRDIGINSGDLCEFTCWFGYCPETHCYCRAVGELRQLPTELAADVVSYDEDDMELIRLCKFACKYGYCPGDYCPPPEVDNDDDGTSEQQGGPVMQKDGDKTLLDYRIESASRCGIYKNPEDQARSSHECIPYCQQTMDQAKRDDRTTSWGCAPPQIPLGQPIPWVEDPFSSSPHPTILGYCWCDSLVVNELADGFIEALPAIGQVR